MCVVKKHESISKSTNNGKAAQITVHHFRNPWNVWLIHDDDDYVYTREMSTSARYCSFGAIEGLNTFLLIQRFRDLRCSDSFSDQKQTNNKQIRSVPARLQASFFRKIPSEGLLKMEIVGKTTCWKKVDFFLFHPLNFFFIYQSEKEKKQDKFVSFFLSDLLVLMPVQTGHNQRGPLDSLWHNINILQISKLHGEFQFLNLCCTKTCFV